MNHTFRFMLILIFLLITTLSHSAPAQQIQAAGSSKYHRSMPAVIATEAPHIDGRLDDPAWKQAEFHGDFIQREPNEGEPATEKTEIAILYDDENLYIGVHCFDSEPDRIRATELRRDGELRNDDNFEIVLDTYHDQRNAFFFSTNPLALRRDGTVANEGQIQNNDWDGVWSCKTSIDEQGWHIEIAIPWQTLRFREGNDRTWGVNFVRRIMRKNEDDYWRLIPRYAGRNGRYRMSEAGYLNGFNNLKMGGKYEFKPYVIGGLQRDEDTGYDTQHDEDFGVDVKLNISSTITADLTYNTDFAQVEADQEQVNLTRFSLYFPEKREFFLEGAETFTFGQVERRHFRPSAGDIQLFYSRRIGIENRQLVPILGGARLNGRAGKYTFGLMSIQTDETNIEDDDGDYIKPTTNYSAVRLKRDVFSRSSVGIMLLNMDEKSGDYNRSVGFDSNFPVNENFYFYFVGAGTYSPSESGSPNMKRNNFAGNAGFKWESDLWEFGGSYLDIEEQFNPEIGFVLRTDIRRTRGNIEYKPRPEQWESIRQFNFRAEGEYQTDHNGLVLNKKVNSEFGISFENTTRADIEITYEHEYLDEEWEIRDGYILNPNGYDNTEVQLGYFSDRTKDLSGRFHVSYGKYFGGNKFGSSIDLDFKALNRLTANMEYGYDWLTFSQGEFHTNRLATRVVYSFSPDLYVKAFLQWYDDKLELAGQNQYSANIIMRYIYRPGSDLFLVFNQESLTGPGRDIIENRTFMLKLNYFLRR